MPIVSPTLAYVDPLPRHASQSLLPVNHVLSVTIAIAAKAVVASTKNLSSIDSGDTPFEIIPGTHSFVRLPSTLPPFLRWGGGELL